MRTRTITTLLIAALALAGLAARATAAGSYNVNACSPTTSPGVWQQVDTASASMASGNQCGGPMIGPNGGGDTGALYGEDVLGSTTKATDAEAGWSFQAPPGTTITAVSYYRSLSTAFGAGAWQAGLYTQDGTALDMCQTDPNPCSSPNNQVPVQLSVANATGLFFGVKCVTTPVFGSCVPGQNNLHEAQADLYSITVTLSESGTPTISNVAGPLWSGGVLSGSATVTFDASDLSGISQVTVGGPSGQVAQQPQSCDYYSTQPCPQLPSGSVSVNTASLPDGAQTLTLTATNAAGNTTSVVSPEVIVDNNGPPAPSSFTATAVGAGSDVIDLSWSDPVNPPQPVSGAYVQLCQATCTAAAPVSYTGAAQLTAPAPGTYTLRLWLMDVAGRGSAANAATTAVTIPPPQPSGPSGPSGPTGPGSSGSTGPSGPTGAVKGSTTKTHPKLRITRHRLKGHRLTLTVSVPAAVKGSITLAVIGYHGANQSCMTTRRVKARHGRASTTFVLTAMERTASRLLARASAAHATTAMVTVRKRSA